MAVSPVTTRQEEPVLTRLARLRHELEALVASVQSGALTLAEVFARESAVRTEPADAATDAREVSVYGFVYLVKLAESVPGIGKVRARRVLEEHGLGERTRVRDVPAATRAVLSRVLA